jgi:hypothetical protein
LSEEVTLSLCLNSCGRRHGADIEFIGEGSPSEATSCRASIAAWPYAWLISPPLPFIAVILLFPSALTLIMDASAFTAFTTITLP